MTRYALFYRFEDGVIKTAHFSVTAIDFAKSDGWEYIGREPGGFGDEPDALEAIRQADEDRWKERR